MEPIVGAVIVLGVLAFALLFSFFAVFGTASGPFQYLVSHYSYEPNKNQTVEGVFVNDTNGALKIRQWNEDRVYVNATLERLGVSVAITSYVQSGTLYVIVHTPRNLVFGWYTVNMQIDLPYTLGPVGVQVATVNGGVSVELTNFSSVFVTSVNGDINLELGSGKSVSASTVNGEVNFAGSPLSLKLSAVNGAITALVRTMPQGEYDITGTNGNVQVLLPQTSSAHVYLATVNGRLKVQGLRITNESLTETTLSGTVGLGSASLTVTTVNGNILLAST